MPGIKACSPTFATPWRWRRWVRWPRCAASWQFLALWNARYSADWSAGGYLAAWGLETTSHWPQATGTLSPLHSRLCEDNTTSPVVSSAIRDRRAFSQGVGVPSLLLLHLHLQFHLHPTDWKLMPCRYSGRSSLGVARSVAPPFNMIGNSSNMYSFYWKLIALWQ